MAPNLFTKNNKKITVITHSGSFHPDDAFAVATLCLYVGRDISIVRTRDLAMLDTGDFVVDVGTEYNPTHRRFDHHQSGGAGVRVNGVPYAAFGLVWKEYGAEICGSKEVADVVEKKLVQPTDADDNGVSIMKPILEDVPPYTLIDAILSFVPTWQEEEVKIDDRFREVLQIALQVLKREIARAKSKVTGNALVEKAYQKAKDKRIIVLDKKYSWRDVLSKYSEPLFIIAPEIENGQWHARAINERFTFKNRKDFPAAWAGKRDQELAKITGVKDAVFCHNSRFLAVAKSKEGALKLAELAVKA